MAIRGLASPRARLVAGLLALGLVAGGAYWAVAAQQAASPQVRVATVHRERISDSLTAVADIEARARNTITLSPSVRVTDVLVAKGERVSRGQVLVMLDTSEYTGQLEQQRITLADALAGLEHSAGPGASASQATADNAVRQAQIGLESARAAEASARQALGEAPGLSADAVRQADLALEGARLNAAAAADNVTSTRALNATAVRQAELARDAAEQARDDAADELASLEQEHAAGQVTQAEYDAQRPLLQSALSRAETACLSAGTALQAARLTADATLAAAEKGAGDAALAVDSAESAKDAAARQGDSALQGAQRAVGDAQRAVRSAEVALANARSAATGVRAGSARASDSQRSQVDLLDASIRRLYDKIDEGRLRASVDGVVSRLDAEDGQYPQLGDAIVVEGASGFVASMDVGQADSVGLRPGLRATVTLKDIGTTYQGSVASVAPVAEKSATSVDQEPKVAVEVSVLDPDAALRIGFEADVEVFLDDKADALTLAVGAVRAEPGSGRRYVYALDEANRVRKVYVRTGIEGGGAVEVLEGLVAGQRCVLDPGDSLADGSTVRVTGGGG